MKKLSTLLLLLVISIAAFAQPVQATPPVEMADALTQSGKIYVVVTVLSIIFAGILVYLIMLDKKISTLEKEIKNK